MDVHATRRRWLISSGLALAGVFVGRRGPVRAADAPVILAGGSTLAGALGGLLSERLAASGLSARNAARPATGLARPDHFDWVAEGRKLARRHRPAGAVLMFGGNDGQALFVAPGRWIPWEDEERWSAAYASRIEELCAALLHDDAPVVWLGYPLVRLPKLRRRLSRIDAVARRTILSRPHGAFLETTPILCPDGKFTSRLPVDGRLRRVRSEDGIHLTLHGARLLAERLAPGLIGHLRRS